MSVLATLPAPDSDAVLHFLNRLTFGPRPGDISRIQGTGFSAWLEEQLHPELIADPAEARVREAHRLAFLDPEQLFLRYPPPNLQRREQERRRGADDRSMNPAAPRAAGAMRGSMLPALDSAEAARIQRGYRELGGHVVMATLVRHVESERQLLEVMTDFWTNHFNVFMGKQSVRYLTADYVERAIRPHALGRFEDLLLAVARHPAMLVYLDNAQSVAPGSRPPLPPLAGRPGRRGIGPRGPAAPGRRLDPEQMERLEQLRERMPTGLNENYARELLELHTLGVDGGYTQQDVQEVARILTGWGVSGPLGRARGRRALAFEFHDWAHDRGEKTVLGQPFPAGGGMDEGVRLLRILAAHPATARHISHKLCARFVADEPPDGCVDAATASYLSSRGDIREVVRAIVHSPDFWAPQYRRAKVKSPLEFVTSALRALGAQPDSTPRLGLVLQQLGQPLFAQQVPTGYPETAEEWVNSGALLDRMNVAMGIAAGRLPGITAPLETPIPATADRDALVARVNEVILGGRASERTLRVIREQIADSGDPGSARAMAVGLAIGSPEFQRQ
jgi:uncharacterized protein (DUF1800 family)